MKHEYTNEVVCPYCDHLHRDSWEFSDSDEHTCEGCEKTFLLEKNYSITYTTKRVPCEDDQHQYGKVTRYDYPQATIDEWVDRGGVMAEHARRVGTNTIYARDCLIC